MSYFGGIFRRGSDKENVEAQDEEVVKLPEEALKLLEFRFLQPEEYERRVLAAEKHKGVGNNEAGKDCVDEIGDEQCSELVEVLLQDDKILFDSCNCKAQVTALMIQFVGDKGSTCVRGHKKECM